MTKKKFRSRFGPDTREQGRFIRHQLVQGRLADLRTRVDSFRAGRLRIDREAVVTALELRPSSSGIVSFQGLVKFAQKEVRLRTKLLAERVAASDAILTKFQQSTTNEVQPTLARVLPSTSTGGRASWYLWRLVVVSLLK